MEQEMTKWRKRTIMEMAKESGFIDADWNYTIIVPYLEAFAALVLANNPPQSSMAWQEGFEAGRLAEREACAKVCDLLEERCEKLLVPDEKWPTPADCANIIRWQKDKHD
jgi:hypothetical protein